jgi:hypothetical protein
MLLLLLLLLVGRLASSLPVSVSAAEAECTADGTCKPSGARAAEQHRYRRPIECGVYMAPSTLGADTNMGIYTGKPLKKDEVVNYPEIAIPLLFREWGDHTPGYEDGTLWDRYIWEGEVMEIETYTDTNRLDSRAVFVPGVGCTVNSVLDMNNIKSTHGSAYDNAKLRRHEDPGTGAFSPYHEAKTVAVKNVDPGSELFADYGECGGSLFP